MSSGLFLRGTNTPDMSEAVEAQTRAESSVCKNQTSSGLSWREAVASAVTNEPTGAAKPVERLGLMVTINPSNHEKRIFISPHVLHCTLDRANCSGMSAARERHPH
ncbi:hypothetical protein KRR26_05990 [Corallococcus sp. M34]|uniref:hypothetical protein n=1 Tax=Citreicoccus inhibens TaxID=2849499 RepID=UPI001C246476|nr:hypothetical protein [Citreicoccus inhibens]MBU8895145.1 hypothetical protein [Citreicoccus inhibens]